MIVKNKVPEKNIINTVAACAVFIIFSVLFLYLFKQESGMRYGYLYSKLNVGNIADYDIFVRDTIDLIDEEKTEEMRNNAYISVLPIFSMDNIKTLEMLKKVDDFRQALASGDFLTAKELAGSDVVDTIVNLGYFTDVGIAYEICNEILMNGFFDYSEIKEVYNQGYRSILLSNDYQETDSQIYEREIPIDGDLPTEVSLQKYITDRISDTGSVSATDTQIILVLVNAFCAPNVSFDPLLTMQRRKKAFNEVENISFTLNRGDLIVQKDRVITALQLDILKRLSKQGRYTFTEFAADFLSVLFVTASAYFLLMYFTYENGHYVHLIWIVTISGILSFIYCYEMKTVLDSYLHFSEYLFTFLPVFIVPYVATTLSGKRENGVVCSVMMSLIFARIPIFTIGEFMILAAMALCSVYFLKHFSRRMDIIFHFLLTLVLSCLLIVLYTILDRKFLSESIGYIRGVSVNLVFTYLVFSFLVPVAERIFNFPTAYRLYELSYTDAGVLGRLSQIAPGSFEHSQAAADIAEAAAESVGANALLCRAGAMYHDIGKMDHPDYFVENQTGANRHDELNPKLSASIIKNHVRIGEEKGREAGLPEEIIEIIAHHHGNDVIRFFYNEAKKESNTDKEEIQQNDFRYDSEIPQTKECAIVMIADSFEAASRTIPPNAARYAKLANSIVLDKINNGQMEKSGLTMGDFEIIKNVIARVALSKNHHRILYPDQEEAKQ